MKTVKIKSINEIKIGDVFVYTGHPRGTGMFPPDIGQKFEMKTQYDCTWLSIEIIEKRRGYEKIIES